MLMEHTLDTSFSVILVIISVLTLLLLITWDTSYTVQESKEDKEPYL